MSIGTEALFWLSIFALVILANLVNEWRHRRRRNHRIVRSMYLPRPKPDSRSSIQIFNRIINKDYK